MNKIKLLLGIYIFLLLVVSSPVRPSVFGYFIDKNSDDKWFTTGSIDLKIDNIKVISYTNMMILELYQEETLNGGTWLLDTPVALGFSINNIGQNDISYQINIGIAFLDELSEKGKFSVYPHTIKDGEEALGDELDSNDSLVMTSDGQKNGLMYEINEKKILYAMNKDEHWLYFYFVSDGEIIKNPSFFDLRQVEIRITVKAQLSKQHSYWQKEENKLIQFITITDFSASKTL